MEEYRVIRSARKTLSLEITEDLTVLVRAPYQVSQSRIDAFVERQQDWITAHRERCRQWQEQHPEPTEEERLDCIARAKEILPQKVEYYGRLMGLMPTGLTITDALSPADRPLNQKWSWDRILRSCFIKQADVLQGLYFLEHLYDKETIRRNFDFYEPMTVHESSLSPCVHSILAASLGKLEKAQELYRRTARLDLDNINNDTCDGLHITSMAGSWLSIVQGFAGMRTLTGSLSFDPQLPDGWDGYAFKIVYRGRLIEVSVSREGTGLKLLSGEALTVMLHGPEVRLSPAEADA